MNSRLELSTTLIYRSSITFKWTMWCIQSVYKTVLHLKTANYNIICFKFKFFGLLYTKINKSVPIKFTFETELVILSMDYRNKMKDFDKILRLFFKIFIINRCILKFLQKIKIRIESWIAETHTFVNCVIDLDVNTQIDLIRTGLFEIDARVHVSCFAPSHHIDSIYKMRLSNEPGIWGLTLFIEKIYKLIS